MLLVAGTLTAGDGAARCTKRADFHALRASLRAALGCAERALHGRTRCTASLPPPCAATAVADAASGAGAFSGEKGSSGHGSRRRPSRLTLMLLIW